MNKKEQANCTCPTYACKSTRLKSDCKNRVKASK